MTQYLVEEACMEAADLQEAWDAARQASAEHDARALAEAQQAAMAAARG